MSEYKKAIVGGLGGLATWLATALAEGGISQAEWGGLLLAILTGAGVYGATNEQGDDRAQVGLGLVVLLCAICVVLGAVMHANGWLFD